MPTGGVPVCGRERTALRSHSPLQAHALLAATNALARESKRSALARTLAETLSEGGPVSALDLAASGWPLGAVLVELSELARAGAVRIQRPLCAGDPAAARTLAQIDLPSTKSRGADPVSMKIAVAGPEARAVVASLGPAHPLEGVVDGLLPSPQLPGRSPHPWVFSRLTTGAGVVYVLADTATPDEQAWSHLLRGAVGLVVTLDTTPDSHALADRALAAAHTAGLPCVLAGAVSAKQLRAVSDRRAAVAQLWPGDGASARGLLEQLAQTITIPFAEHSEEHGGRQSWARF